jgi:hypothetical protein
MKRLLLCSALLAVATTVFSQKAPPASPPATATGTIGGHSISIAYASPAVKGREGHIFTKDGLIGKDPHYPVWRAGANSATTLKTDADIKIGDLDVPAGTYTLFVDISDPDNWVLIVSKATGEWGLAYDASKDLGKTKLAMAKPSSLVEHLKYTIASKGDNAGTLTLANHEASVSISAH